MFDRHYHTKRFGPSRVEVHEHRAPTDESVRMLRELEAEARSRVLAVHTLDNVLNVRVLEMRPNEATSEAELLAVFGINGESFRIRCSQEMRRHLVDGDAEAALKLLVDAVAREIAVELVIRLAGKWSP